MVNEAKKYALRCACLSVCVAVLCFGTLWGCASASGASATGETVTGETAAPGSVLVCKDTVSPNEAYVDDPADVVTYTVEIYQEEGGDVVVEAASNSPFFGGAGYRVACGEPLSEEDVEVKWTALMGNPVPSEDDQWAVAHVSLSLNGEVFSDRSVNFVGKAVDAAMGALEGR